jgi:hypothetical protein
LLIDKPGRDPNAMGDFAYALRERERRYFTVLPGPCASAGDIALTPEPDGRADAARLLVNALFDLVRHGGSHQYQQIAAELTDGRAFGVAMSGVQLGEDLGTRHPGYLGYFHQP